MFDFHRTLQRKVQRRILLTPAFLKKNPLKDHFFFLMIFYFKDHFLFTDVWKQDIGHNDLFTVKMRGLFLCVYLLILCVSSSAKARCPCCSCVLGENSWLKINHLNTEQNFWIKIWSGSLLKSFGIWHLVYFIIYVTSEILSFIP